MTQRDHAALPKIHRAGSRCLRGLAVILIAVQMMRVGGVVEAADGDIDTTFGSAGKVTSGFFFLAMAIQSDGKIIAGGGAPVADPMVVSDFGLARYGSNGSLDPTFGSGGQVTTHFATPENIRALAIQPDGKIVATGILGSVVRYTKEGVPDDTFGAGGKVKADIDITAVTVQADGKIVLAGFVLSGPGDFDFAVARLNPNGSPDSAFGTGGKVITSFSSHTDAAFDVIQQPDGKIIVLGYADEASAFAIARFNSDGSLDANYGSGGRVQTSFTPFSDYGIAGRLLKDGNLLVCGVVTNPLTSFDFGLAKYRADGSLDTTFGSGGFVATDFNSGEDIANDIAVQADGKILVVGRAKASRQFESIAHWALARYNSNGTLDTTFGSGGRVITSVSDAGDAAYAVGTQTDGRIVVAGNTTSPSLSGVLIRYDNKVFDTCIQDDSNGNLLQVNLTTGAYEFSNCSGVLVSGTGSILTKGCYATLQANGVNFRVQARMDTCAKTGSATIQLLSSGITLTIMDRKTASDMCSCVNSSQ